MSRNESSDLTCIQTGCSGPPTDILAQLRQLAEVLVAARDAFVESHGEELQALGGCAQAIASKIRDWCEENQADLIKLQSGVAYLLRRLPEWQRNWEANQLLLERGLAALDAAGLKHAGYVLSLYDAQEFANLDPADVESRMYAKTTSTEFAEAMLELYNTTGLRPDRAALIGEALVLHRDRRFAGAITLLYSQLEGLLTDALTELRHAHRRGRFLKASDGADLRGLDDKLKLARAKLDGCEDLFTELLEAALVTSDAESTVRKSRNRVLHGDDVTFATETRSTQLILWQCSLLIQLRSILTRTPPPESMTPTDRPTDVMAG